MTDVAQPGERIAAALARHVGEYNGQISSMWPDLFRDCPVSPVPLTAIEAAFSHRNAAGLHRCRPFEFLSVFLESTPVLVGCIGRDA